MEASTEINLHQQDDQQRTNRQEDEEGDDDQRRPDSCHLHLHLHHHDQTLSLEHPLSPLGEKQLNFVDPDCLITSSDRTEVGAIEEHVPAAEPDQPSTDWEVEPPDHHLHHHSNDDEEQHRHHHQDEDEMEPCSPESRIQMLRQIVSKQNEMISQLQKNFESFHSVARPQQPPSAITRARRDKKEDVIVAIASEAASEAGKNWELMEADERSEFMKLAFSKYKLLGQMLRVKAQHEELVGKHDWQLVTSDLSRDAAKILRVSEGLAREKLLRFLQNKRYYSKKVRASHHLVFGGNRSKVNPNQKSKTAQSESPEKDSKRDEPIAPCPEQLSPTLSDSLGLSEEKRIGSKRLRVIEAPYESYSEEEDQLKHARLWPPLKSRMPQWLQNK